MKLYCQDDFVTLHHADMLSPAHRGRNPQEARRE